MSEELLTIAQKEEGLKIKSTNIADLVKSINKALIIKRADLQESGINIKSVELILKTLAVADSGANISLQIPILGKLSMGSKISEKSIQTTSLTLTPTVPAKFERGIAVNDIEKTVAQSISSIIEGVNAANNQNSISMVMDDASFTFNFILSGDSSISMIIGNGFESELSNTIKIKFERVV